MESEQQLLVNAPYDGELNPNGAVKKKKSRWGPEASASQKPTNIIEQKTLQEMAVRITSQTQPNHWTHIKIPPPQHHYYPIPQLTSDFHTRYTLVQKILFADRTCGTRTPKWVIDEMLGQQ